MRFFNIIFILFLSQLLLGCCRTVNMPYQETLIQNQQIALEKAAMENNVKRATYDSKKHSEHHKKTLEQKITSPRAGINPTDQTTNRRLIGKP